MRPFTFTGFMVPVFTIFDENDYQTVNSAVIDEYAAYLKGKGIEAVLVNGTTGEGTSLTYDERKLVTEKWSEACKKYSLKLMVQVGGTCFNDVVRLAKYAESCEADAILCLPELYFKPRTVPELVAYLKEIGKSLNQVPLFYYHIPMLTDLNFSMPEFMDLAETEIPNFQGIKYTSDDLDSLPISALTPNRSIFIGSDVKLHDALARGFSSFIMTTLNICPGISMQIRSSVAGSDDTGAAKLQGELTATVQRVLQEGDGQWVKAMKKEFNKCGLSFKVGLPRKPL